MSTNDGGPAFPRAGATIKKWDRSEEREETYMPEDGMTLRDYFAAKADTWDGDCDSEAVAKRCGIDPCPSYDSDPLAYQRWWARADAAWRYMQADAMLAERAKDKS